MPLLINAFDGYASKQMKFSIKATKDQPDMLDLQFESGGNLLTIGLSRARMAALAELITFKLVKDGINAETAAVKAAPLEPVDCLYGDHYLGNGGE